jgi:hypothetical protein
LLGDTSARTAASAASDASRKRITIGNTLGVYYGPSNPLGDVGNGSDDQNPLTSAAAVASARRQTILPFYSMVTPGSRARRNAVLQVVHGGHGLFGDIAARAGAPSAASGGIGGKLSSRHPDHWHAFMSQHGQGQHARDHVGYVDDDLYALNSSVATTAKAGASSTLPLTPRATQPPVMRWGTESTLARTCELARDGGDSGDEDTKPPALPLAVSVTAEHHTTQSSLGSTPHGTATTGAPAAATTRPQARGRFDTGGQSICSSAGHPDDGDADCDRNRSTVETHHATQSTRSTRGRLVTAPTSRGESAEKALRMQRKITVSGGGSCAKRP